MRTSACAGDSKRFHARFRTISPKITKIADVDCHLAASARFFAWSTLRTNSEISKLVSKAALVLKRIVGVAYSAGPAVFS